MSRYAVISDIHGNLHALESVLGEIHRMGLPEVICLGDIVGYGPFPDRCIDLVVKCCAHIVRGNHDDAVINPEQEIYFNGPAREAIMWTRSVLGPLHLNAMVNIAEQITPHESVLCLHDSPIDSPTDYIHDANIAAMAFGGFSDSICLVGHTHVPVVFDAPPGEVTPADIVTHKTESGASIHLDPARRHICNPGSVGQPRDTDPRASFAVLDMDTRTFTVHRCEYDIDAAQLATQQAGLPFVLAERLAIGA